MIREREAYWLRALGLWVLLMAAETLQGLWRVKVLTIWLGDEFAHDVGVFTGSLIILLITFACIGWIPAKNPKDLLFIGAAWVVLTIGYEAVLGHLAFARSWSDFAADFDVSRGRLLPWGLLILLFSPWLAARMRGRFRAAAEQPATR